MELKVKLIVCQKEPLNSKVYTYEDAKGLKVNSLNCAGIVSGCQINVI